MRKLTILVLAALLSGCNLVHSETPLFGPADTAGAPVFRTGLWVGPDRGCRFDAKASTAEWPSCAQPVLVEDGRVFPGLADERGVDSLVALGDPLIVQFSARDSEGARAIYYYSGLQVTRRDRDGKVVALRAWPVDCGPPPPEGARLPDGKPRYVTLRPGPGLEIAGDGCRAREPAAVRAAARASARRGEAAQLWWVRDRP